MFDNCVPCETKVKQGDGYNLDLWGEGEEARIRCRSQRGKGGRETNLACLSFCSNFSVQFDMINYE